jgi:P2 family phage contractile tail tube protein
MLPRTLYNYNLFVDGRGYAGRVDELALPKLTLKVEEHRGGGMDAGVDLDMGMEKLDGQFTLAEYDQEVMKRLFVSGVPITIRGALTRQGETQAVPVVIKMTATMKDIDRGTWKAGDKSPMVISYNASSYIESIGGVEVVNIDVVNMRRVIGGVDQLGSIRAAIGV